MLLTNPFYYGHFRYAGEVHEGIHEPVISKKLFDQIQEVLHRKSRHFKPDRIPKSLTGLFRCGECGMMITAEQKTKYYPQTNNRVTYVYYRCTKKSKTVKCNQKFIRQESLDSQLSDLIQKVSLRQDWADKMFLKLNSDEKDTAQSCRSFVQKMREEIKGISLKLQFLLDSYLDQIIDKESYQFKKAELLSKKKTIEEKIFTFEQIGNAWLGPMKEWINDASQADKISESNDLNAKKVLAQKIFGSDLWIKDKKVDGKALSPWAALRAAPTSRSWVGGDGIGPSTSFLSGKRSTSELTTRMCNFGRRGQESVLPMN